MSYIGSNLLLTSTIFMSKIIFKIQSAMLQINFMQNRVNERYMWNRELPKHIIFYP